MFGKVKSTPECFRPVPWYLNWFSSPLSENKILPTKSFSLEERKDVIKVFSYECGIGKRV
jgi:hypothetical protein